MIRKSTVIALTAAAALGLAIGNASAGPGGPGMGKIGGIGNPQIKPIKPIKIIPSNPVKPIKPIKPKWPPHVKPKWPKPPVHVHVHRRVIYAAPAVYAVSRPAAPGPCTCLSKEYTQEGAVLFKDRCTNEMAMNPPPPPQQQTGMVEQPQQQTVYMQQPPAQPNAAAQ
jgi:hypothetical protein